jgi:pyruvate, orthophosphate dikinase
MNSFLEMSLSFKLENIMKTYTHPFGIGKSVVSNLKNLNHLLGGKGANLAKMAQIGLPVPPGFTLSTEVCHHFVNEHSSYPDGLEEEILSSLKLVEKKLDKSFGNSQNPLLLSVRSGARISMPGMMDTILNLGLNDSTVVGLADKSGDSRFAYDCYRRFVQMYGDVVLGLKAKDGGISPFEKAIDVAKERRGVTLDTGLLTEDLKELVQEFKQIIKDSLGVSFPENPLDQLKGAITSVFQSWNTSRAISYRQMNKIPDKWGTAVNVQSMVYGNWGDTSGTGVAFTRDPATGKNVFYGEYLLNAQGEDVVAGTRTPQAISVLQKAGRGSSLSSLEEAMPKQYETLLQVAKILENHFKDMQDIEFTIERGKLWMLQTRIGKRTGFAAFKMAMDMVSEGLITQKQALMRIDPEQLNQLLRPIFDPEEKTQFIKEGKLLAKGLNAAPGAVSGQIVFSSHEAELMADKGHTVILVRIETSPEDIRGINAAEGILTARGGMTSHAALVARQMGKICVVGCSELEIDVVEKTLQVGNIVLNEGDYLSIDGTTGEVLVGRLQTIASEVLQVLQGLKSAESSAVYQNYEKLMNFADKVRRLKVKANADQPEQAELALAFGAEGIGLCRTEHMFFEEKRLDRFREMILAPSKHDREYALKKLLPFQQGDFEGLFKKMVGNSVIIRLLDPPLHEFLPTEAGGIKALAEKIKVPILQLQKKINSLNEVNPMLGHRGCRLGITYSEITQMQTRAIIQAACYLSEEGMEVCPKIMVPLVSGVEEFRIQKEVIQKTIEEVFSERKIHLKYEIGTMIELPRAVFTAHQIAKEADFFSYGTNDLTQTTFGLSRDDANTFLPYYLENSIWSNNPFQQIDEDGVGQLIQMGLEKGRSVKTNLSIGICGEHGGDPASVEFCHRAGLDYVSCSPYRIPIARLAAAQAVLREK